MKAEKGCCDWPSCGGAFPARLRQGAGPRAALSAQWLTNRRQPTLLQAMKVIEYKTATADTWASLDKKVNALLAQGFQLYGNPYSSPNTADGIASSFQVAQAMVRNGMRENPDPQLTLAETTLAP